MRVHCTHQSCSFYKDEGNPVPLKEQQRGTQFPSMEDERKPDEKETGADKGTGSKVSFSGE